MITENPSSSAKKTIKTGNLKFLLLGYYGYSNFRNFTAESKHNRIKRDAKFGIIYAEFVHKPALPRSKTKPPTHSLPLPIRAITLKLLKYNPSIQRSANCKIFF